MADQHHHHLHRPSRISLPQRAVANPATPTGGSRPNYPLFPYPPSTPAATPSKRRLAKSFPFAGSANSTSTSSFSFLFLILFSLRSLYSLLPFIRSSPPTFSLFPFSFLVSLLSFLLTLSFSLFASSRQKSRQPLLALSSINRSQHKLLLAKSFLLAIVFLFRFQALKYCSTAAFILAELSGNVAARFMVEGRNRDIVGRSRVGSSKVRGFAALLLGLFLLSVSWDRMECFPLSAVNVNKFGLSVFVGGNCVRFWPMLLPFLSGFLGCYERISMNWGAMRELGRKRVRLITLFFTTIMLSVPALISMFVFEAEGDSISILDLGWPLANTVVFGVLLSENYTDERLATSKDFRREYLVTFLCTLVLELFYFPELSLWGLLVCGFLLWISIRELDPSYVNYMEMGFESSESLGSAMMKPIRHILSERKSRKIALFLLINTAYMVVEFVAGFMSNSLGLISDACHMLFDCAALAIGLYASYISRLPANNQFNYGRGRFEILSGYVNAVFLVLVGALIVLESLERILEPQEISTSSLLAVSVGGLVVNIVGLIFFHEEHHHAHGGSGPCSHSHSHSHPHSESQAHSDHHHHHHHHDSNHHHSPKHDIKLHHEHQEGMAVVHDCHEVLCNSHDVVSGDDHYHNHQTGDQQKLGKRHGSQYDGQGHQHNHCENHHHHGHHQPHHHIHVDDHDHPSELHLDKVLKEHHHHNHHIDHNMQGIFLHVLADTMGSVGVVISTLLIKYKGWLVADPASSIFISGLIVSSVIPLLRNSAEILLQRVPRAYEDDLKEAVTKVMNVKGVVGIQNLHMWSFTNTDIVGTLHLQVSTDSDKDFVKKQVSYILHDAGVKDLTLQVEPIS